MGAAVQDYVHIVKRLSMGIVDHEVSDEADFLHKMAERVPNGSHLITCWDYLKEVIFP
jgi:hypothetical protein